MEQISLDDLQLNELNKFYFDILLKRKKNPPKEDKVKIFEDGVKKNESVAYPTAILPDHLKKDLPYAHYQNLMEERDELAKIGQEVSLWCMPMQAGSGSSIERKKYLSSIKDIPLDKVKLGSKGTDLFLNIKIDGEEKTVSLAEVQILRALKDAQKKVFKEIIFNDIVSIETAESIKEIWNHTCPIAKNQSYLEYVNDEKNDFCSTFGPSFQNYLPTINDQGNLTKNRMAPGGHALFGIMGIRSALFKNERPKSKGKLVGVIGNGEDLSAVPDSLMVGHMIKNKIPIVMVTTEKTSIDLKGGQIALIENKDKSVYASIIEKAQAEDSNQIELFEKLGLRPNDQMAFFNTNMALFNYEELIPLIEELTHKMGEESFFEMIAPNLIENYKEQVDTDGVKRKYLQLEGAMGSVLLNLDKISREKLNRPAVHFINVEKKARTNFFGPIKTAFDFFMQFYSDRFTLSLEDLKLVNNRPLDIPQVELKDSSYKSVDFTLENFKNTSILKLDALHVQGKVNFSNCTLIGHIEVDNQSDEVLNLDQFKDQFKNLVIKDSNIICHPDKTLSVGPLY